MSTIKDDITEAGAKFFAGGKPIYDSPNNRLRAINAELVAVLEKIADLHRGPGSALAKSALDTMRLLDEKR